MSGTEMVTSLKGLVLVSFEARTWGARKKAKTGEVEVKRGADKAPKGYYTDPQKHLVDPKDLQAFNTLDNRVRNELNKIGTPGYGGWLIPETDLKQAIDLLWEIEQDWFAAKQRLVANVEVLHQKWLDGVADEWQTALKADVAAMQRDIERQVTFTWRKERFEIAVDATDTAPDNYESTGPKARLYDAIAEIAGHMVAKVLEGKDSMLAASTVHFQKIRSKLKIMGILDPRDHPGAIIKVIDAVLARLPEKGTIAGPDFIAVFGLANILANPALAQKMGHVISSGQNSVDGFISTLLPQQAQPQPVADAPEATATPAPAAPTHDVKPSGWRPGVIVPPTAPQATPPTLVAAGPVPMPAAARRAVQRIQLV